MKPLHAQNASCGFESKTSMVENEQEKPSFYVRWGSKGKGLQGLGLDLRWLKVFRDHVCLHLRRGFLNPGVQYLHSWGSELVTTGCSQQA